MKVVINNCWGGYGISTETIRLYAKLKGIKLYEHERNKLCFSGDDIERHDPFLIKAIEQLGEKANTRFSKLEIIEIPDGIEYEIDDYGGMETIHEKHRSWG